MKVKFKLLSPLAKAPTKAHATDAGFDIVATSRYFDEIGNLVYGTSVAVEIPEGYVGYIFPRSSLCKYDLALTNCVGVIDSCYRGEITLKFRPSPLYADIHGIGKDETDYEGSITEDPMREFVTMYGHQDFVRSKMALRDPYTLNPRLYDIGDRIGQLIIMPIPDIEFEQVDVLTPSERGKGGYGSTGR